MNADGLPDIPPTDPADHAEDFAHRWTDKLDRYAAERMEHLGIPPEQIGASDNRRGIPWRAFFPDERDGGGNGTGGRLNLDSGILNPDLLIHHIHPEAASAWAKARLRDRIDAAIAHEMAEGRTGDHLEAEAIAPDTPLPVSEGARHILRAMAGGKNPPESPDAP